MAEIIEFPKPGPPRPFRPSSAVRKYLAEHKCTAVAGTRIPWPIKRALMHEAFISDARFSEHLARILTEHLLNAQGLHGDYLEERAA